jgi:RNA polymerase sigma-70 factor (sigma-E family)
MDGGEMSDADPAEFDELFRHEYPLVVGSISLVLGDRAAAEDVVQDAFAQLLLHWRKVSRYERPGAWVRRVALRMALRWRTRRAAETRAMKLVDAPPVRQRPDLDLTGALRALPAIQRAAVVLHYFEDRPVAEVADLLGCAEGTAKTHLHRARRRLSALLLDGEESDVTR